MVPEGWERVQLSELASDDRNSFVIGPFGSDLIQADYRKSGVPIVFVRDVKRSNFKWISNVFLDREKADELKAHSVRPKDIVITKMGLPPGIAAVYPEGEPSGVITADIIRLRPNLKRVSPKLLCEILNSYFVRKQVSERTAGQTRPKLTLTDYKSIRVFLPHLREQQKIAKILSTWDEAIATTEQLLVNSEQQKKALMQQLLTGKKRLPGFEGEWIEADLGDLFSFKKGAGLSKGSLSEAGANKCVLYGELYTKYGEVIGVVESRTDAEEGVRSKSGDVLIPCSTTTSGIDLANATALIESGVLLGGDITILRPISENVDAIFVAHYLTHEKKHEIASMAQGITIVHLYGSDLKSLKVRVPASREEQGAIANVFVKEDRVIAGLTVQLRRLNVEKKALMQQLLTGKRRVKIDETERASA